MKIKKNNKIILKSNIILIRKIKLLKKSYFLYLLSIEQLILILIIYLF